MSDLIDFQTANDEVFWQSI